MGGGERRPEVDHRAVVLIAAIEIQSDVAVRVRVGGRPTLRPADGQRLAGVETALLPVQYVVAQHQVPVGMVQLDQFFLRRPVDRVRRPAGDGALQRIQVMPAVVDISRGGQHGQGGQAQQQAFLHNAKIQKTSAPPQGATRFPPFRGGVKIMGYGMDIVDVFLYLYVYTLITKTFCI